MNNRVVNRTIGVILLMAGMVLTGCESPEAPMKTSTFDLPIRFVLPASEVSSSRAQAPMNAPAYNEAGAPAHAMSDPGDHEEFVIPTHLYIFCAFTKTDDSKEVACVIDSVLETGDWLPGHIGGDSCYYYTHKISIPETPTFGTRKEARVYVVMSDTALVLKKGATTVAKGNDTTWPASEDDIKALKFTVDSKLYSRDKLQQIYTTPSNYVVDDKYYGTVRNFTANAPRLDLVLYRVASKVDVMWNVPNAAARDTVRITGIQARYLFTGDAYLFQPTKNRSDLLASGVDYTISGDNAGQWWAGRNYFYTIPYLINTGTYAGKCPLQLDIKIKDTKSDAEYTDYLKIYKNIPVADTVFVPWMRGQIKVSNPLTADKADVKVVD